MTAPIENAAMRLSWEFAPGTWQEPMQFGVHTGIRDSGSFSDIADLMETFFGSLNDHLGELRLTAVVLSDWDTGPGFTGWHQVYRRTLNTLLGVEEWLPPQIALVVGVRNTADLDIALGRRRNRSYLGSLAQDDMDQVGQLTTAAQLEIVASFNQLHEDLQDIPADGAFDPEFNGLCVASPTEGVLMQAQELVVGRAYDTMRSRRQKVPEYPSVTSL